MVPIIAGLLIYGVIVVIIDKNKKPSLKTYLIQTPKMKTRMIHLRS